MLRPMVQYSLEHGLRKVKPYYFRRKTNCKGRWFNRTVADVFAAEFRDRSREYYEEQVSKGNFKILRRSSEVVQGSPLMGYQIGNGDVLEYTEHQHEPVVPSGFPKVVYEDESVLVVNKLSGVPVHPTQKFFYNSITEILKQELGLPELYPCHRLDKLTSGVLILGKDAAMATKLQRDIQDKNGVEKLYLARVNGKFPERLVCEDPIATIQTKKAFANGVAEAKPAKTAFKRVSYDTELDQSVVECQPITGRTHQIRIHLRNVGHPICNDPLYGLGGLLHGALTVDGGVDATEFTSLVQRASVNRDSLLSDEKCTECGVTLYKDYRAEDLVLWLHSLRYKIRGMVFETAPPQWSTFR